MDFPLADLMDQDACYQRIVKALHPDGLTCPRCGGDRLGVHRRHRAPVLDYRRRDCRRAFNAFTGAALHRTSRSPAALAPILRGIARGASTAGMARELGCDRMKPLALRHKPQANARAGSAPTPSPDPIVEADECYVSAGGERRRGSRAG